MKRLCVVAVFAVLVAAWALPALACPVCYGEAEGKVIDGTKMSMAFLGSLVYLVFAGAGGLVFALRRRVRRLQDPRRGLCLVDGPDRQEDR
ncbi:MAG TPA: hypothetical protein VHQ65_15785 [Thermoanaerobaculia bacterium]|nr:hypothetical protein [Thermoanaerobaculia bacterium]